jgi:hypothetical protein
MEKNSNSYRIFAQKLNLLVVTGGSELDSKDKSNLNWSVAIQDQLMWEILLTS